MIESAPLNATGPANPGFEDLFTRFRTALLAHADKEESSEFEVETDTGDLPSGQWPEFPPTRYPDN